MRGMWRPLPLLALPALAAAACAPAPSSPERARCGVMAVRHVAGPRIDPTGPIPACALPTADEIALACSARRPHGANGSGYYRVGAPSCRFADAGRSRAACSFELAEIPHAHDRPGPAPVQVRENFVLRYGEAIEPDASGYGTYWEAVGRCSIPA
jgi:hypothetical protein